MPPDRSYAFPEPHPGMDHDHYGWTPLNATRPVLEWPDKARVALCVIVTLEHFRPFAWEGEIMPGGAEALTVLLEPEPTTGGTSIFEEPALWIVVASVVVVTGAIVGGYFAWDGAQLRPETETVIRL